jgi:hypothetical protein
MKTVRQLVDFIFHSSQEQEVELTESDRDFLVELNNVERVKANHGTALLVAMDKAGLGKFKKFITTDEFGELHAEFDNSGEYAEFVSALFDGGQLYALASEGWVATYSDDVSKLGDTPKFRVNFLSIGEVEPGETKGHEAEDVDMTGIDKIAIDAFKANNELKGRKDHLRPKDDNKVAESRIFLDSLTNAAETVAKLLSRSIEEESRCKCGHDLNKKGRCEGCDKFPEKCDCGQHPYNY